MVGFCVESSVGLSDMDAVLCVTLAVVGELSVVAWLSMAASSFSKIFSICFSLVTIFTLTLRMLCLMIFMFSELASFTILIFSFRVVFATTKNCLSSSLVQERIVDVVILRIRISFFAVSLSLVISSTMVPTSTQDVAACLLTLLSSLAWVS